MNVQLRPKRSYNEAFPPPSIQDKDVKIQKLFEQVKKSFKTPSESNSKKLLEDFLALNPKTVLLKNLILHGNKSHVSLELIETIWAKFFQTALESPNDEVQKELISLFTSSLNVEAEESTLIRLIERIPLKNAGKLLDILYPKAASYPNLLKLLLNLLFQKESFIKGALDYLKKSSEFLDEESLLFTLPYFLKFGSIADLKILKETFKSPETQRQINQKILQRGFLIYSPNPRHQNLNFSSLIESNPDLFSKSFDWITKCPKGLVYSHQFLHSKAKGRFVNSVIEILLFAENNPEFHPILSSELDNALASCVDRSILSLNRIHLHKRLFEARGKSEREIFEVFRSKVATEVVQEYAATFSDENEDPIERQLYLEIHLRNLPLANQVSFQNYPFWGFSAKEIQTVRNKVLAVIRNPKAMAQALTQKEPDGSDNLWIHTLKEKLEVKEALEKMRGPLYELLDTVGTKDWSESFAKLSRERQRLFYSFYEKEKEKGDYLAKCNAIAKLVESSEENILFNQTVKIITPFINDSLLSRSSGK